MSKMMKTRGFLGFGVVVLLGLLGAEGRAEGGEEVVLVVPEGEGGEDRGEEVDEGEDEETIEIGEVVVTGTGTEMLVRESPVPVDLIGRAEIEMQGGRNLADLLSNQPGIETVETVGGTGIRIQGFDPKYTLVLVDGEPVGGRINGAVDLSRYHAEEIERVEILRGAGATLYGADALAGVVNIVTRHPDEALSGEAKLAYGVRNALDVSGRVGWRGERVEGQVSGHFSGADGYDLDPSTVATTGSAFGETGLRAGGDVQVGAWRLGLKGSYLLRNQERVDAGSSRAMFDRYNRFEDARGELRMERQVEGAIWEVRGSYQLFRNQFLYDQRGSDALDRFEDRREQQALLQTRVETEWGRHLISAGLEGGAYFLEAPRIRDGEGQRFRGAVFGQDEWLIDAAGTVVIVPGGRVDVDSQYGVYPTMNLAGRWSAQELLTLRGSVGRGYRAPSFQELLLEFENPAAGYRVAGNPDLRPETSWSFQTGGIYSPADWIDVEVNLFWNAIDDLITTTEIAASGPGEPTRFGYDNIEEARTGGVELMVKVRPADQVELSLGYTLTDTLDRVRERQLEGRARHRVQVGVVGRGLPLGLEASAKASFVGCRPFYGGEQEGSFGGEARAQQEGEVRCRLGEDTSGGGVDLAHPYALLEARLGRDFGEYFHGFLRGTNLTNAGDVRFLPIAPRTVQVGLRGRF